jgi:hypothetical protein
LDLQIGRVLIALFVLTTLHTRAVEPLSTGEIEMNGGWPGYGSLAIRGVPFARESSLQAYAPGWKEGYFSSAAHKPSVKKTGDTITLHYETDRKVNFSADETYRVTGENQIERTLRGKLDGPTSTSNIEWALGYLNVFPLYDGSYSDGKAETRVVAQPQQPNEDGTVIHAARSIAFQTRLGTLTYTIEEGDFQLSLLDGRRGNVKWWSQDQPTFWLGVLAGKIEPGKPFTCRVSIKFEPGPRVDTKPPQKVSPKIIDVADAFVPQTRPVQIIPQPKKLEWGAGRFALDSNTPLIVDAGTKAAELLQREMHERFNWNWKIAKQGKGIHLQNIPGENPERYTITVTPDGATIASSSDVGLFYGAQTLLQMIQLDKQGAFITPAGVDDWPTLAFRGVHLFTGKDAMPLQRKLVERIFARYKFNHLVLEADYTQWETNPKLTVERSVPKDQVRDYVKLARENFLEPIPLVQSLGHAEWMFTNGQNTELAEDPQARYAYAVTNPKTYDFIEKIYTETLDLFGPTQYFHIGHDEVNMIGGYPHREDAKKWGASKLFTYDVNKLNDFFKPKGVKLMLWGDMLLDKSESSDQAANAESVEEAKARRDAIPKDAVICDWHYEPRKPEAYKSLKVFKDAGFKTLACTWYTPENIHSFARAAHDFGAWGLLQTTWAGYSVNEKALQSELRQFTAYILAAEYAWNADVAPPADQFPWRADDVFIRSMNPAVERTDVVKGFQIELGGKSIRANGVSFNAGSVMLGGELARESLAKSIEITVNRKAAELEFLQSSAFRARGNDEVATYTITYDDGSTEKAPLIYGKNIRAAEDLAATSEAMLAGDDGARLMTWRNPHAEKTIRSITFATSHPYASPTLIGITGLSK